MDCHPAAARILISIFNLGMVQVGEAKWMKTRADVRRRTHKIVRELNPGLEGLVDLAGASWEQRGKGRYAKLEMADKHPVRHERGIEIIGRDLPIFAPGNDRYRLVHWFIFVDGYSRFGV